MKCGIVADVHLGNHRVFGGESHLGLNDRFWITLDVLVAACKRAEEAGCEALIVLGDLFDVAKPSPQMLYEVGRVFKSHDLKYVLLRGNHDCTSELPDDWGALAPLANIQRVNVYGAQPVVTSIGTMSGYTRSFHSAFVQYVHDRQTNFFGHFGLYSDKDAVEPWMKEAHDAACVEDLYAAMVATSADFRRVFVGNWHGRREFKFASAEFIQVGALVPTGFDNPGYDGYGSMYVFDTDTNALSREVIPGPRFVTVRSREELDALFPEPADCTKLFVRWVAPIEQVDDARTYISSIPGMGGYEVVIDEKRARQAAKTAALTATTQQSLRDAAIEYVGRIPLEGNVRREKVWEHVQRALKL